MRDPNRIDTILAKIAEVWKKAPDLRLCQLIYNQATMNDNWKDKDLFYFEDDSLLEALNKELTNSGTPIAGKPYYFKSAYDFSNVKMPNGKTVFYPLPVDNMFDYLRMFVPWVNRDAPRDECFMAKDSLSYTYGKGVTRTYNSVPFNDFVDMIMSAINYTYGSQYNVCFLNYYKDEKQHLGWHSDDSPEMDMNHPIAVVSFGAEREIWVKHKDYKGEIPKEDRYSLSDGSLFIMPAGYQKDHLHKIPKHDQPCGGRISLTFRRFINK